MTLVVDILARAARQCSVLPPGNWLTATAQTSVEFLDFLSETIDDIQERVDLTGPMSKTITITGDGGEEYALPADFKRLHRSRFAVYEKQRTRRECIPVTSDGDWEYMKELGVAGVNRYYRQRGYDGAFVLDFYRPPETGIEISVSYVSTAWLTNGGTEKSNFTDSGDVCYLPRRLIEAGIVFRFRERKGLEFTDKQAEYEALLARMSNDTRGRRAINFGPVPQRNPWDVPVPDFIPES